MSSCSGKQGVASCAAGGGRGRVKRQRHSLEARSPRATQERRAAQHSSQSPSHTTHTHTHTRCVPVSQTASLLHDLPGAPTGARACVCVAQLPVASALCPRPRVRPRACLSVCDRARTQLQARTGRQRIEDSRCVKSPLLITDLTSASTTLSSRSPLALTHCVSDERPACDASRRHRSSHGQARDQGAEPEDQ